MPFVHGGAEVHVRELVRELRERGHQAELVSVPFKRYPKDEILPHAAAWRLLDLSESNGQPIDLVITGGRPAEHPRQRSWIQSGLRQGERAWVAQYGRSYAEDRGATHRLVKGELGNTRHT